jgi:NAD(P)-dependent dehydrogenase (short-subunit alcohol dehydrogenase family)
MDVNLHGALFCTRAVLASMRNRGGGVIVNQSSTASWMSGGYYALSKAAINSLTVSLAHELGGSSIRVNAIAPGPIDTAATRSVISTQFQEALVGSLAIKRMGRPDDLVGLMLFLLSDEARWITGQIIAVDGGQIVRT